MLARVLAAAAATAASLLAVGLAVRVSLAVPVALGLLGGGYVALLGFEAEGLHASAPLVAGGLYAIAELAYWSLELRGPVADERGTYLRRLALLAAGLAAVTLLGVGLLALVEAVETGGVAIDLIGGAAAVAAVALLALAARRPAA
ncbi:MAG TPA: hypothetical protein VIA10_18495 [Gaiellaceae bacterium]